jgi:hypothetical protein
MFVNAYVEIAEKNTFAEIELQQAEYHFILWIYDCTLL